MKTLFTEKFFRTSIRIFLGLIFFSSGMSKLTQHFPGVIGPVWLEHELEKYQLGLYARFIAYSQVIIGFSLLNRRFATLGAVMLLPMLLNILMVTISMDWRGTPYVNAFLLLLNIILLISDFHKLKFLIHDDSDVAKSIHLENKNLKADMISIWGLLSMLIAPMFYKTNPTLTLILVYGGIVISLCSIFFRSKVKALNDESFSTFEKDKNQS